MPDTPIYDELKKTADNAKRGVFQHKGLESHFGELSCSWCGRDLDYETYTSIPCTELSWAERMYLSGLTLAFERGTLTQYVTYGREVHARLFDLGLVQEVLDGLDTPSDK